MSISAISDTTAAYMIGLYAKQLNTMFVTKIMNANIHAAVFILTLRLPQLKSNAIAAPNPIVTVAVVATNEMIFLEQASLAIE